MLIDNLGNQEYRYEFYLCKSFYPHEIVSCITECSFNRSLKFQLMSVDEIELDIANIYNDGLANESFDLIQIANTIKVETYIDDTLKNTQLFHIYQLDQVSGDKDIKSIKGYSLEYRFNKLKVRNFKATTFLYKNVPFDYETPTNSGIMDYLLELLEHTWTISYVTPNLLTSARSYDISESNLLDTINTIQSNYNAIFFYNTINRTIQIKSIDVLNEYSGIVLSTNNYIKQYKNSIKMDEIFTRLYITGSGTNNTGISSVNVTGKPYIDNFTAFMTTEFMSSGLISALTTLNNLRQTKQADFNNYLSQLSTKQGELDILNVEMNTLLSEKRIIENHEDVCIKTGSTSSGLTYSQWHTQYVNKVSAISIKQGLIDSKEAEIAVVNGNIATLVNLVSYETNLTLSQRQELLNFINETSVKFDTSDAETLMLLGTQLLNIKSSFQYDIELDMVDIYSAQSESINWQNITLGKKANINLEDLNVELEPMIVAISHGYDNNSLSVSVSNKTYLNGDLEYISAIFASSKKASTILENEKDIYTQFDEVKNNVIYDTTPISTTNNPITLEDGSALLRRGIYMRDSESANGQMKILGDRICFSRDNWNTVSVGINSAGITTNGSFKLISEKTNGSVNLLTINGDGISIYGDGTEGNGISIYNATNQKTLYLGSDGALKINEGYISLTNNLNTIKIDPTYGIKITNNNITKFEVNSSTGAISINDGYLALTHGLNVIKIDPSIGIEVKNNNITKFSLNSTTGAVSINDGYLSLTNNKSRSFIDPTQFKIEKNIGTVGSPSWTPVFNVDSDGNIGMGGKLFNLSRPSNYMIIGGDYADLVIYRESDNNWLKFYDNGGTSWTMQTRLYNNGTGNTETHSHMTIGPSGTYAEGNWDFGSASISGMVVKFS